MTGGSAPSSPAWAIRVPASSANLGPGFDVLGMALSLHATVGIGAPPGGAHAADEHHPATVAYRRLGGSSQIWVHSPIPAARGLGFSGAVRVGGAAAAAVERYGVAALDDGAVADEVLAVAVDLEGHADNAAASMRGGVVIATEDRVAPVKLALDVDIVVWIPDSVTASTDGSRAALPAEVSRADVVFNLGQVALLITGLSTGDADLVRYATADRLHQPDRLQRLPTSAAALAAALDAGAIAAWLSGSGPTVAIMVNPADGDRVTAALPSSGHVKKLRVDPAGARVVGDGEFPHPV